MTTTAMIIGCTAGLYLILSAAMNWDRLFGRTANRWIADLIGRTGARILFAAIGLVIIGASVYTWLQAR
ncbi:MAG TPA: hypothetical protein VHO48_15570 [Anaerolineaceae bacterium]|jgi:hypothetical protein|nr:hypothetical protein [Anaerolineaceae bacterium]